MSEPRPAIKSLRRRKERHKQRSKVYRVPFALAGVLVIVAGVALSLPGVPGPGLLLVAVGLGMLALEFDRAERLLEKILDRVEDARERTSVWQQVALGVIGLAAGVGYVVAAFVFEIPVLPG
ncbi:MAG: PGPGW domain-containing protein [Actinobacteria bacterium]|nr:PGPGW domain-containing protein [Actinomycetota bacterium]